MKLIKRLSLSLCLMGLIMYLPQVADVLTLHFGTAIGHYSGIVSFAMGWSLFGAGLAFSAGQYRQHKRIEKEV